MYCLKALRAIESGQGIDPRYKVRPCAALLPAEHWAHCVLVWHLCQAGAVSFTSTSRPYSACAPDQEYQPDDPAVKALLTRDISSAMKEPYKAAVEDCLIITMKGAHSC